MRRPWGNWWCVFFMNAGDGGGSGGGRGAGC